MTLDNKAKMIAQREMEEMQRNFDRYKVENSRSIEKMKVESDEMMKRTLQENMRRVQTDTERMLAAAKKKSWCSNCIKEVRISLLWKRVEARLSYTVDYL